MTIWLPYVLNNSRVDKKRDKLERKVLDSQERAFWDVHRPAVSSTEALLHPHTLLNDCLFFLRATLVWSLYVVLDKMRVNASK